MFALVRFPDAVAWAARCGALLLLLIPTSGLATSGFDLPRVATPQIQLSKARKPSLRISCRHPSRKAYTKRRGVMRFTLTQGDIGGCPTDRQPNQMATSHAPYMERVEIYTGFRPVGPRYRFSAQIHMSPDFQTAPDTTVFQVHQWVQESCRCEPPVMLGFDNRGDVQVWYLNSPKAHQKTKIKGWNRAHFEDKWVEVAIDIVSAYGRRDVIIWLGGIKVFSRPAHVLKGGALFMKTGLYRPGSETVKLPTDRMHVKNTRISIIH